MVTVPHIFSTIDKAKFMVDDLVETFIEFPVKILELYAFQK